MKYPRLLSSGANNKVIALTETEAARLYNKLFEKYIEIEIAEMEKFKTYFLSR